MKSNISIVGGGACALALAAALDGEKYSIAIYEKNAAPGRKFLVAGDGGFNLTHSEDPELFIQRYTPSDFLKEAFRSFSNLDFVRWLNDSGIETCVGSSGRVFPKKGMKPVEVLNVILGQLKKKGVTWHTRHNWQGFTEQGQLLFDHGGNLKSIQSDLVVFCLGGASWPVTGSTGDWPTYFKDKHISVLPFEASNCSFQIAWPVALLPAIKGKALKNGSIRCGNKFHAGEVVLTTEGLEGSGIYPLSPQIRKELKEQGRARIYIDLKPAVTEAALLQKLEKANTRLSYTRQLAGQWNLNELQLSLLKWRVPKAEFVDARQLVKHIKSLELEITGTGPVEEAISTVGGIALQELTASFELKKLPGHFAIGEMLDFDAPTGGYLLQSCFSMGHYLAQRLNAR